MEFLSRHRYGLSFRLAWLSWTHRGDLLHVLHKILGKSYWIPVSSLEVPARRETWTPTGVSFESSEGLQIRAWGCVIMDPRRIGYYPDGSPSFQKEIDTTAPNVPIGTLLGKFESEEKTFVIGKKHEIFEPATSNLALMVNDKCGTYGDNEGVYQVQVWRQVNPTSLRKKIQVFLGLS